MEVSFSFFVPSDESGTRDKTVVTLTFWSLHLGEYNLWIRGWSALRAILNTKVRKKISSPVGNRNFDHLAHIID
jgi:hypothetical protein